MPYVQESLRIAYKRKDSVEIAGCLAEMGNTFMAMGQNEMARTFFRQAISFQKKTNNFYYMFSAGLASSLNGISQSFYNAAEYDSSLAYARQALVYGNPDYLSAAADSYSLMYMAFEKQKKRDSSNEYYRLAMDTKNTVMSDEKSKDIQSQHFKEEIRQQEIITQRTRTQAPGKYRKCLNCPGHHFLFYVIPDHEPQFYH